MASGTLVPCFFPCRRRGGSAKLTSGWAWSKPVHSGWFGPLAIQGTMKLLLRWYPVNLQLPFIGASKRLGPSPISQLPWKSISFPWQVTWWKEGPGRQHMARQQRLWTCWLFFGSQGRALVSVCLRWWKEIPPLLLLLREGTKAAKQGCLT